MQTMAFIGGGNMAAALITGLRSAGESGASILVVDPDAGRRAELEARHGVEALAQADGSMASASLVVWAVKPQFFAEAAAAVKPHLGAALQLSVMAGIRTDTIARATGTDRVVRAMPNTPALIGQGVAGLYARASVDADEKRAVESVLKPTGAVLWVDREDDLDAVTALSGSGPAYVFYLLAAMVAAGERMGLAAAQARQLALATFAGSTALAAASDETLDVLRQRVTSKGGTTAAALDVLEAHRVAEAFIEAMAAARRRAEELGRATP